MTPHHGKRNHTTIIARFIKAANFAPKHKKPEEFEEFFGLLDSHAIKRDRSGLSDLIGGRRRLGLDLGDSAPGARQ